MDTPYQKDNQERVPFEHYLELYRKADPEEMSARTGIPYENGCFRIRLLGTEYRAAYPAFQPEPEPPMWECSLLMIRFLLKGAKAEGTGKYLTFREMPWGEVYDRQFHGRCVQRLARNYGNRPDDFAAAMESLGARKISAGDAGYEIELTDGFWIRFMIWNGDEEFPASAQILFSDNFAAAFEAEDLVAACDVILGMLKRIGG